MAAPQAASSSGNGVGASTEHIRLGVGASGFVKMGSIRRAGTVALNMLRGQYPHARFANGSNASQPSEENVGGGL